LSKNASTKKFPKKFVLSALEQSTDDAGWAQLGTFGSYLTKLQPDFDSRLYGFKKLSDLVKAKTIFLSSLKNITPFKKAAKIARRNNIPLILNPGMLIIEQGFDSIWLKG